MVFQADRIVVMSMPLVVPSPLVSTAGDPQPASTALRSNPLTTLSPLRSAGQSLPPVEHEPAVVLHVGDSTEKEILIAFWKLLDSFERKPQMIGFNTKPFDLPFLIKRSWKHRVTVPYWIRSGRYWNDLVVDLREVWQLGDNRAHGSLNAISRHLGLGEKSGNGAHFSELFQSDRQAALDYCRRDVQLTRQVSDILIPTY